MMSGKENRNTAVKKADKHSVRGSWAANKGIT